MKCPFCGYTESKVIDSRPAEEGATIRRRRECLSCGRRFTTYEVIDTEQLVVIKKDGSKEFFDRRKIVVDAPIKAYGTYQFDVKLYPEITGKVNVLVAE